MSLQAAKTTITPHAINSRTPVRLCPDILHPPSPIHPARQSWTSHTRSHHLRIHLPFSLPLCSHCVYYFLHLSRLHFTSVFYHQCVLIQFSSILSFPLPHLLLYNWSGFVNIPQYRRTCSWMVIGSRGCICSLRYPLSSPPNVSNIHVSTCMFSPFYLTSPPFSPSNYPINEAYPPSFCYTEPQQMHSLVPPFVHACRCSPLLESLSFTLPLPSKSTL